MLKEIGYCLLSQITDLINKSIELGQVPDILKVAKVLPLYKSKESNKFTNYRPISLLPSLSKILERVVHKRLYSFLQDHNLLHKYQYGFRKKRSTVDAVTEFVKDRLLALDNNEHTVAVFFL